MAELKTAAQDWRSESRYILCMLALGLWGYLPIVTGRLTNAEGSVITLIRKTGFDWEDRLGRFGLRYVAKLQDGFITPELTTVFCLILLACLSALVCRFFGIKKGWAKALTGIFVMISPNVVNTLCYYSFSGAYIPAYFLSVAAAYLLMKKSGRKSWLAAVVLTGCYCCLYQAYIGVTVTLCVFWILKELLLSERKTKELLAVAVRGALGGLAGIGLYLASFHALCRWGGVIPADSRGFDSMGRIALSDIPVRLKNAYVIVAQYFLYDDIITNSWMHRREINFCIGIVGAALILWLILRRKLYRDILRLVLIAACLGCAVAGLGCIAIIGPGADIYESTGLQMVPQMNYAYCLVLLLAIGACETEKLLLWPKRAFVALLAVLILVQVNYVSVFQNCLWLHMNKSYAVASQILDRIFEEGYFEQPVKLMIGGSMKEGNYSWTDQEMERVVSGSIAEYGMFWSGPSASRDSWQGFYRTWFGMDLPMCSAEEYEQIRESEAYRKMSCFPNRGSTGRVGDVFVVKLSD